MNQQFEHQFITAYKRAKLSACERHQAQDESSKAVKNYFNLNVRQIFDDISGLVNSELFELKRHIGQREVGHADGTTGFVGRLEIMPRLMKSDHEEVSRSVRRQRPTIVVCCQDIHQFSIAINFNEVFPAEVSGPFRTIEALTEIELFEKLGDFYGSLETEFQGHFQYSNFFNNEEIPHTELIRQMRLRYPELGLISIPMQIFSAQWIVSSII